MNAVQIRQAMVDHALWGVAHTGQISYQEVRPIPNIPVHRLPFTTDCSGFITIIAKWAGAPDPNGHHYEVVQADGRSGFAGFTGDMLGHLSQVQPDEAFPGDLVIFLDAGPKKPEHVVILTESGKHDDPFVVSHGGEDEPKKYRLSTATSFHTGQPIRYLRLVSNDIQALPIEPGGWNEAHLSHIWHVVHSDPHAPDAIRAEVARWKTYFFALELWAIGHELNAHHNHELVFAGRDLKAI